jgi:hypothetical protein
MVMQASMGVETYREPARDIPVLGHWDVIVAGGGPAGCAAAWAAARCGARTLLVEKSGHLGGQTVDALVCAILSTNGVDFQGIWHDWIRALRKRRGADQAMHRSHAHMITTVYPESVKYAWDIDIWPADSYTKPAVRREDADYKERHVKVHAGDYFDIPYGCIVAQGVDNLLMAGQCLSASHVAESSLRIQQTCMATRQAAGTAAAMSLERKITPREFDPAPLLARLIKDRDATEPAYDFMRDLPVAQSFEQDRNANENAKENRGV